MVGDVDIKPGIVVEGILAAGSKTYGKIVVCVTDYVLFSDVAAAYERLTGRPTVYIEVPSDVYQKMYGDFADEFGSQVKWSEEVPDWHAIAGDRLISLEELGVADKLVGFE